MDPTACLERIQDAVLCGDDEERDYGIEDLETWLEKGGFEPYWNIYPIGTQAYQYHLAELTFI